MSIDRSDKFALALIEFIKRLLEAAGVPRVRLDGWEEVIYVVTIVFIALVVGRLSRVVIHYVFMYFFSDSRNGVLKILTERKIFSRSSMLIPPLIIISLLPFAFDTSSRPYMVITRVCWIYLIIAFAVFVNLFLTALWNIVSRREGLRDRPLKGLLQITKGIVVGFAVIFIVSMLAGKSPMNLITGLGAFAAVLMLVFRDSILGFVAGVQLSENDMVRRGDWIVVPGTPVNGVVLDITLNTVKVRNFDNTTMTIPPYTLISKNFQNWRGMSDSGGRRIKRGYNIDAETVGFCTPEMLEEWKKIPLLTDYITRKQEQRAAGREQNTANAAGLPDGTIETNLGVFRAYMTLYLRQHPLINRELTLMVRTLAPGIDGLPLEIYCFSADKVWTDYESVQAEIMEHFLSVLPRFGLRAFQQVGGRDIGRVNQR
ncbi:MAG: mechanosensitive ion channel family protein [Coprobacter sp.]|nr:mechanosensitive ion channel family protein [Coprobacter sp.]